MGLLHGGVNTLVDFINICRTIATPLFDMTYFFIKVEAGRRSEVVKETGSLRVHARTVVAGRDQQVRHRPLVKPPSYRNRKEHEEEVGTTKYAKAC